MITIVTEERRQRIYEKVQTMCLMDDNFMSAVLQETNCCELVINTILGRNDIKVEQCETQHSISNLYGRSVKLDVFASDDTGKKYNIEVQRTDKGAVPQRARYNSSLIDASITEPGDDYIDLPETYVIFITEKDVLGGNEPIYEIERVIRKSGSTFGDGSHIIYVNSQIRDNTTALGRLMHDFHCINPDEMHYDILAETALQTKLNKEGKGMCKIVEDIVEEMVKDELEEAALRMIAKGKNTPEEIAEFLNLPLAEIEALIKKHSA